ncbi:MAG: hypothetical protein QOF58_4147 [Pseudonocardiales bacterium]|jgi:translation initiation factor IF-2|nr:hypothetical protein [Pseudonocardiales bacterium]
MATEHQNTGVAAERSDEPASQALAAAPRRPWYGRLHRSSAAIGLGTTLATVAGMVITFCGPEAGEAVLESPAEVADGWFMAAPSLPDPSSTSETPPSTATAMAPSPEPLANKGPIAAASPLLVGPRPAQLPTTIGPKPAIPAKTAPVPPPAKPAPVTYSATAGPACGGSTQFIRYGEYQDGNKGWINHGGGCGSGFVSVPMSGNSQSEDPRAYTLWNFTTGPVASGSCAVSVYVPNGDLVAVGGDPTYYRVFERFGGAMIGSFQVRQVAQRGQWLRVGTYRITGGRLSIQMINTGVNWNSQGATWAHHAAAAIRADCTV